MILDAELRLSSLDENLSYAQNNVDELMLQLSECFLKWTQYKAVISPVRRLPPEILCQIFLDAISSESQKPHKNLAPLSLCQVCESWRWAALGLPKLWTHLVFSFKPSTLERDIRRMEFWLNRAKDLALSLSLCAERDIEKFSPPDAIPLSHLLNCRTLQVSSAFLFHRISNIPLGSMVLLENLTLSSLRHSSASREKYEGMWKSSVVPFRSRGASS